MVNIDVLICTSVLNKKLYNTIDSILSQSYNHNNIILINDTGYDIKSAINKRYNKKVNIYKHDAVKGLTNALKFGERFIKNKYVARVDVGDELKSNRFEMQVNFLENNTDYAIIGCRTNLYFETSNNDKVYMYTTDSGEDFKIRSQLINRNPMVHGSLMIRSDILKKVGGYNINYKAAQDLELYMKIIKVSKIGVLSTILHSHIFTHQSTTLIHNKRSSLNALMARLKYYQFPELINIRFIVLLAKTLLKLLIPKFILKYLFIKKYNA
jgi:glycosyltransferase involved in cell wall biosynthesis